MVAYNEYFNIELGRIYLNSAAVGIIPRRAVDAMNQAISYASTHGEPSIKLITDTIERFHKLVARMLNVGCNDIAFIHNTTEGLSIALQSIPFKQGDNIIIQGNAFPASYYIVHYCLPNIEKRYIDFENNEQFFRELAQKIDEHTRAFVVDHAHFLSGQIIDLSRLSKLARTSNIFTIVDGIQIAGTRQLDITAIPIDFYTAGGMKWLFGPMGTGFIYVNPEKIENLKINHVGWLSTEPGDMSSFYPLRDLRPDARRFEQANFNLFGMIGLIEALELFISTGYAQIESQIHTLTVLLINNLEELNYDILTPAAAELRAGIVTFRSRKITSEKIYNDLRMHNIICSMRDGWVRIAIHFFNSTEQIIGLITRLKQMNLEKLS